MLTHDPRHPTDRKGLNLTIKAYKWHQNDRAHSRHLSRSKINIYICTALCRNQKRDLKITIHGERKGSEEGEDHTSAWLALKNKNKNKNNLLQ